MRANSLQNNLLLKNQPRPHRWTVGHCCPTHPPQIMPNFQPSIEPIHTYGVLRRVHSWAMRQHCQLPSNAIALLLSHRHFFCYGGEILQEDISTCIERVWWPMRMVLSSLTKHWGDLDDAGHRGVPRPWVSCAQDLISHFFGLKQQGGDPGW